MSKRKPNLAKLKAKLIDESSESGNSKVKRALLYKINQIWLNYCSLAVDSCHKFDQQFTEIFAKENSK